MKKSLAGIFAALCCIFITAGCATTKLAETGDEAAGELYQSTSPVKKREIIKMLSETYTPENSVLVYGSYNTYHVGILTNAPPSTISYLQVDRRKPAQHLEYIGGKYFFFKPVVPGGQYKAYYFRAYQKYNTVTVGDDGIQSDPSVHDFTAPQKPGLYFIGDFENVISQSEIKVYLRTYKEDPGLLPEKYAMDLIDCEKNAVNYALKFYADTAWEPLLRARLEELNHAR